MKAKNLLILLLLLLTSIVRSEEICIIERASTVERIENRTYPSTFGEMEHVLLNYPRPDNIWEWGIHGNVRKLFS